MFRKVLFWSHLVAGVATGGVVAIMSVTGVLLTYERQILAWAERSHYREPASDAPQPIETLLAAVRAQKSNFAPASITLVNDPAAPLTVAAGRGAAMLVDRYTGAVAERRDEGLRAFFGAVTGWHRWFNADGDTRATARAITGASNVAFLFLIASGMYLWLPRVAKWAALKTRLLFNAQARSGKARDFNWHHVFGIWSAVPLFIVVATATVFSYPWASDLVYRSFGEEPPVRGARGGGQPQVRHAEPVAGGSSGPAAAAATPLTLAALLERAAAHLPDWRTITLTLPSENGAEPTVRLQIDQGNGGQPQLRHTLLLDARTGDVAGWQPFESQTPGQRARSFIRFLHTGEALGIAGQTIAGLVSFASVIMVWTGLALAYRRLIAPLLARRSRVTRASTAEHRVANRPN